MEAQIQAELTRTATEAAAAAVAPHLAVEADLRLDVEKLQKEIRIWKTASWIMFGATCAAVGLFIVSHLIPAAVTP